MTVKTAEEKLDSIAEHIAALHKKHDSTDVKLDALSGKHDALSARMDALEKGAAKAKADAELPRDGNGNLLKADSSEETRNKFGAAQMRLDAATQAWGHQCRSPLAGESLRDFRISVLTNLKKHSRAYRDSDLSTIGDENAFSNIEGIIINDAIEASKIGPPAGQPLRKHVSRNEMGHTVTTYYGDPAVAWAPFMGGQTRFGRINRAMVDKAS